ncbi:TVP38/TMEM64 family protein [Anaerobacillus sp. MEB173]|uniref:TVP38/TMEM64 family protein n=1 Tax=Anaerobacillus sp. MEB173 TaxID=3383345 RepID=UPI003F8E6DAA
MKKEKWIIFVFLVIFIVGLLRIEEIQYLLDENIVYFTEDLRGKLGYRLLWITIPLAILQGVITVFPFFLIIIIHVSSFGLIEGFLFSWIGSFLGAIVCFILARYFSSDWTVRLWNRNKGNYQNWLPYINIYGVWVITLLRNIPIIPSNMISIMAALSPIGIKAFLWSSVIGNKSMVWLLTLLSSPIIAPDKDTTVYIFFCSIILFLFYLQFRNFKQNKFII